MRIAQIAPLAEAVPPKLYGGTERVVFWLTEELVRLGQTSPCLHPGIRRRAPSLNPAGLRPSGSIRATSTRCLPMP
jgi:hypothetical protein